MNPESVTSENLANSKLTVVGAGRDRIVDDHLCEVGVLVRRDRLAECRRHLLRCHVPASGKAELLSTETVDVAVQDGERTG
jgi:hypothetical protein